SPPNSSSTVMPCSPSAPISGHSSMGKRSSASMEAASGAMRSSAKRRVASRIMSACSPSANSKPEVISLMVRLLFRHVDEQQGRLLDQPFQALHETRRLVTINDAVIEGGRQIHQLANDDLPLQHHRALHQLVGTENSDFWRVDDRGGSNAAQRAQAGQGNGRAR